MGSLKEEALNTTNEDIQQHKLTDSEMGYLRLLNVALQFHTLGQKIVSGFLYYVCIQRLGYKDGVNLQFEIDLNKQDSMLTVKLLPEGVTEVQQDQAAPEAPVAAAPEEKPEAPKA
jgi:hypothetical protein